MTCPSSCRDDHCSLTYAAHLRGLHISADATPTRCPTVAETNRRDKILDKDLDAYKSLRQQGLHPNVIDGCDRLSATATSVREIEQA